MFVIKKAQRDLFRSELSDFIESTYFVKLLVF